MKVIIRIFATGILVLLSTSFLAAYIPPSETFIFAIAGLGFPFFWIMAFLMFAFLLIIKERLLSIISAVILIVSAQTFFQYFNISLFHEDKESQYSILDFNTFGLKYPDTVTNQIENQRDFNNELNNKNYSVICFQEYPMKGSKHAKFYQQLDEGLNLPYKTLSHYYWDQKNTDYILVTTSKFLILDEQVFTQDGLNFAMYSDIKFPEKIIRVYNVHFQSVKLTSERKLLMINRHVNLKSIKVQVREAIRKLRIAFLYREKQAGILEESIRKSPYPVIIAGDFNDTPASFVYRIMKRGLKDASSSKSFGFKRTYKFSRFPLQIDYLIHSPEIETDDYHTVKQHLSDHYAITSRFSLKEQD